MTIDHAQRLARFAVGELATFTPGPRAAGESGPASRWRMELGAHWHREAHAADAATDPARRQEVPLRGALTQRGWLFQLEGRIDQLHATPSGPLIRELKTTLLRLPADPAELRAHSPGHFVQLGLYLRLHALAEPTAPPPRGELVFIEAGTGLQQVVPFSHLDEATTEAHLDLVADFLEARRAALARLRSLTWQPAFTTPRPGQ